MILAAFCICEKEKTVSIDTTSMKAALCAEPVLRQSVQLCSSNPTFFKAKTYRRVRTTQSISIFKREMHGTVEFHNLKQYQYLTLSFSPKIYNVVYFTFTRICFGTANLLSVYGANAQYSPIISYIKLKTSKQISYTFASSFIELLCYYIN